MMNRHEGSFWAAVNILHLDPGGVFFVYFLATCFY